MKKYYITLAILTTTVCFIKSQSLSLRIYPDFNNCLNCNTYLHFVKELNTSVSRIMYVEKSKQSFLPELLSQYGFTNNYIVVNRPIHKNKVDVKGSICALYDGKLKLDSFALDKLPSKIGFINFISSKINSSKLISLNDSLKLSNRFEVNYTTNSYIMVDYLLNKAIYLRYDKQLNIEKKITIEGQAFNPRSFLKLGNIDSIFYKKEYTSLKYVGKHLPHIEFSYLKDSMLYLMLTFPYPLPNKEGIAIDSKLFLYQRNVYTDIRKLIYIKDIYLENFLKQQVNINNSAAFYVLDNGYYFSIANYMTGASKAFIAKYYLDSDTLKYDSNYKVFEMDSLQFKTYQVNVNESLYSTNEKFYFGNSFPYIYNYLKDEGFYLKELQNAQITNYILDVKSIDDNYLTVFINKNTKGYFLLLIDLKTKKIIREKEIKIPENCDKASLRLLNTTTIIALDVSKTQLVLLPLIEQGQ
jgi:hypothetical protein